MPDWRPELRRRLAGLDLPPLREAEIATEVAQHLDDRYAELRRGGVPDAEARRLALDEIADEEVLRRGLADTRVAPLVSSSLVPGQGGRGRFGVRLWQDVRYGTRTLLRRPGFAAAAVLALAIGISANSAIFAAVDAVLLRAMPFPRADRMYVPISVNTARHIDQGSVTFADVEDWRAAKDVFAAIALWRPIDLDLVVDREPERVEVAQVSDDFFRVLDTAPIDGRLFVPADHDAKAQNVAVLTYALWQRAFGGASVVGQTVRLADVPVQVVGILPPRVAWPTTAQLYVAMKPAAFDQDVRTRRDNMIFAAVARLQDGTTFEAANARLASMAARLEHDEPVIRKGWTNSLITLRDNVVDADLRVALLVLLGAVGAVLLIACANVANLALVRGSGRAREFAVRVSLGASRRRLIQQLVVESLIVTAAGAALGCALAVPIMRALVAMAPAGHAVPRPHPHERANARRPRPQPVRSPCVISAVLPALSASVVRIGDAMRDGATGSGASRRSIAPAQPARHRRSGCDGGSAHGRGSAHPQLRAAERTWTLASTSMASSPGGCRSRARAIRTMRRGRGSCSRLRRDSRRRPDVEAAALTSFVPVGGGGFGLGRVFLAEGRPEPPAGSDVAAQWNVITPDYFRTLGIPMRQGRAFTDRDTAASTPVIIVSTSFARRMFPDEDPIGKRVRSWRDENLLREIVGVVADVKYRGLADTERPLVYVPHTQNSWGAMRTVVRARHGDRRCRDRGPASDAAGARSAAGRRGHSPALRDGAALDIEPAVRDAAADGARWHGAVACGNRHLRRHELRVRASPARTGHSPRARRHPRQSLHARAQARPGPHRRGPGTRRAGLGRDRARAFQPVVRYLARGRSGLGGHGDHGRHRGSRGLPAAGPSGRQCRSNRSAPRRLTLESGMLRRIDQAEALPPPELWPARLGIDRRAAPMNLAVELVDRHLPARAHHTAIVASDGRLTYGQLAERAAQASHVLSRAGIDPGDRVLIRLPNSTTLAVVWLAAARLGAISVITSTALRTRELEAIVTDAEPAACVVAANLALDLVPACDAAPLPPRLVVAGQNDRPLPGAISLAESAASAPTTFKPVARPPDAIAAIVYAADAASTTPKGACYSVADMLVAADRYARQFLDLTAADVVGGPATPAFAFGLGAMLVFPLRAGAASVLDDGFDAERLLSAAGRERVTLLFATATAYRLLLRLPYLDRLRESASLRLAVSSGERLDADTAVEWQRRTGIELLDAFGTTEMAMSFSVSVRANAAPAGLATQWRATRFAWSMSNSRTSRQACPDASSSAVRRAAGTGDDRRRSGATWSTGGT